MSLTAPQPLTLRTAWKGGWLLTVAAIHTVFAAVVFLPQLEEIVRRGVIDSVGTDPMVGAVAWFVLFGVVLALLGWAVLLVERHMAPAPGALRPLGLGCWPWRCWALRSCPLRAFGWCCHRRWHCAGARPPGHEGLIHSGP